MKFYRKKYGSKIQKYGKSTKIYRISKNISIFADVSSFNNYGQNLTWNGKHSGLSNNAEGHMYSTTLGLSFALNNNKIDTLIDTYQ